MWMLLMLRLVVAAVVSAGIGAWAAFAQSAQNTGPGAVPQNIPPAVSQNHAVPPLALSEEDRAKIRQALSSQNTEVSFALKSAKAAEKFEPSLGAKIPKGVGLHPLSRPLVNQIPVLKRYTYSKFKEEVLIVNPMNRKIVDMFPES